MSAEGQYYRYIVNRRQNSERGFLHMYTGNYECLELFVKPEAGKKGSVSLKKVKENKTESVEKPAKKEVVANEKVDAKFNKSAEQPKATKKKSKGKTNKTERVVKNGGLNVKKCCP